MLTRHFSLPKILFLAVFVLLDLSLVGCGSNQEDMIARASRRRRPSSDSENENGKTEKKQPAKSIAQAKSNSTADEKAEEKPQLELTILPISERKPKTPLNDGERRRRAYENMTKISKAMLQYVQDKKQFPRSKNLSRSRIETVSWRVSLLPYLGYDALYSRFDLTIPWDEEPNISLLEFIPDEYVSPERFDTKTNFQLPAADGFIFERVIQMGDIEDGPENTLMLLEVNEDRAVAWTEPADYSPSRSADLREHLGGLRGDGAFAVWANGRPTLIPTGVPSYKIFNALTYEMGDGQLAGEIHRKITIEEISDASIAAIEPAGGTTVTSASAQPMVEAIQDPAISRDPVPIAADVAKAQRKLRSVFMDQIREAKKDDEKRKLASKMLTEAQDMESDPAGAFALQIAAMRLATETGDFGELARAVDQRIGRFEVDAYDENAEWFLAFGQATSGKAPSGISRDELLGRAVRVVYAGIQDNDFMRASAVARIAYRFTEQDRHEEIPKLFNRLRVLLGTAQREYDAAVKHLEIYRLDSSDGEAGASFGRFICFIKGDWEKGLPMLTQGGPEDLMSMAKLDLKGAGTDLEAMKIADAWWDLSERARKGVYRQAARDRAAFWYQISFETLPESLNRLHVKARLDEIGDAEASSPIALCKKLGKELGVDLNVSLAAVADVGTKGKRRGKKGGFDEYD